MKHVLHIFLLIFFSITLWARVSPSSSRVEKGGFTFVSLNCENLFDCQHDSLKDDQEFMPNSYRRWSEPRMWMKLNHIAQEILSCGDDGEMQTLPDMVALCEVENDSVLTYLTQRSLLRNAGYRYIMTDSPDLRGIDVALLYSPFSFAVIDSYSIRVNPIKGMRPTRDILYVKGKTVNEDTLHVFVVHAPSRSGGEVESEPFRICVAEKLTSSLDSIRITSPDANIIVAGDFNDYTNNRSLKHIVSHSMIEASAGVKGRNGAKGTYKYQGEWGSLDHIFLSPPLKMKLMDIRINDVDFLLCKDDNYGGVQPFRNYQGYKWQNGFSDHLPLIMQLDF